MHMMCPLSGLPPFLPSFGNYIIEGRLLIHVQHLSYIFLIFNYICIKYKAPNRSCMQGIPTPTFASGKRILCTRCRFSVLQYLLSYVFVMSIHLRRGYITRSAKVFTDWERFQSLASELISPRIQINLGEEADKAACDFIASVASAYRLSTRKITLSDLNNDLPGLESLLKYKRRLRKLWQVTRDPACKTAVKLDRQNHQTNVP
jgi:hypothetical protein